MYLWLHPHALLHAAQSERQTQYKQRHAVCVCVRESERVCVMQLHK